MNNHRLGLFDKGLFCRKKNKVQGGTREARDMSAQTQQPGESSSSLSPSWSVLKGLPTNQPPFDTFCFFFHWNIDDIFGQNFGHSKFWYLRRTCSGKTGKRCVWATCNPTCDQKVQPTRNQQIIFSIKSSKTSRIMLQDFKLFFCYMLGLRFWTKRPHRNPDLQLILLVDNGWVWGRSC